MRETAISLPKRSRRRHRFCDRGAHQFQARCPASRSRPSPAPGGGSGKQARSCFLVGPAVWSRATTRSHGQRGPAERSSPAWAETRAWHAAPVRGQCRPRTRARPEPSGEGRPQSAAQHRSRHERTCDREAVHHRCGPIRPRVRPIISSCAPSVPTTSRPRICSSRRDHGTTVKSSGAMHDDDLAAGRLDGLADTALDLLSRSDRLIGRPHARRCLLTNALQLALTQACKGRRAHLEGTAVAQRVRDLEPPANRRRSATARDSSAPKPRAACIDGSGAVARRSSHTGPS